MSSVRDWLLLLTLFFGELDSVYVRLITAAVFVCC
jgi:hypothetical protein